MKLQLTQKEKDNKIECLEDELRLVYTELENYENFFKNMQKMLDKQ